MVYIFACFVGFFIGAGLRTSERHRWTEIGIAILLACIPGYFLAFYLAYGWQGFLVPLQVLEYLILPLLLVPVALTFQWAAKSPSRLKRFTVIFGLVGMAWIVALVVAYAPWGQQVIGK